MDYRIERNGSQITVWDDHFGVGLRFNEGESLQRYESCIVLMNPLLSENEAGMAIINFCQKELTQYASQGWLEEFQELR